MYRTSYKIWKRMYRTRTGAANDADDYSTSTVLVLVRWMDCYGGPLLMLFRNISLLLSFWFL